MIKKYRLISYLIITTMSLSILGFSTGCKNMGGELEIRPIEQAVTEIDRAMQTQEPPPEGDVIDETAPVIPPPAETEPAEEHPREEAAVEEVKPEIPGEGESEEVEIAPTGDCLSCENGQLCVAKDTCESLESGTTHRFPHCPKDWRRTFTLPIQCVPPASGTESCRLCNINQACIDGVCSDLPCTIDDDCPTDWFCDVDKCILISRQAEESTM